MKTEIQTFPYPIIFLKSEKNATGLIEEEKYKMTTINPSQIKNSNPLLGSIHSSYCEAIHFPQKEFEQLLIQIIHNDDILAIPAKLIITNFILQYNNLLDNMSDFFEEECHLSLLNWIFKEKELLMHQEQTYSFKDGYYTIFLELVNNILNIFESISIKSEDILHLKLYEKLTVIKSYFLKWSVPPFQTLKKISSVLLKWKNVVDLQTEKLLMQKRKRNNIKEKKVLSPKISNLLINKDDKQVKKNKKVLFDLSLNKENYFNREAEPESISFELNKSNNRII